MSTLEQRESIYKKTSISTAKKNLQKFRVETNDYFCQNEGELISLIEKIPNWKTYLTDKQLVITELYLNYRNTNAIDCHLKLTNGIAYHTLFGNVKNKRESGGVFKKLKNVYKILQQTEEKKRNKK